MRNILSVGMLAAMLTNNSLRSEDINYNVQLSSGVQNNTIRYGVKEIGNTATVNAGVTLEQVPYISKYDLNVNVNTPFNRDNHTLTVISTGVERNVVKNVSVRAGVEYGSRTLLTDDFNTNVKLAYDGISYVRPYTGYMYDYINHQHIFDVAIPARFSFNTSTFFDKLTFNTIAGYSFFDKRDIGQYQTIRFGGGVDVPLYDTLFLFMSGTYHRAVENASVAFHDNWVASTGLRFTF